MMRTAIFIAVVTILFGFGCNALEHDPTPLEGFSPDQIEVNPYLSSGKYEGVCTGSMTLEYVDEGCPSVDAAVGEEIPVVFDILHAGPVISIQFEDETEANGRLRGNRVTVVKRGVNDTRMYHLEFVEEAGTTCRGQIEVLPGVGENASVEPCAMYNCQCSLGE